MTKFMALILAAGGILCAGLWPGLASAEPTGFDGSRPLLCASVDTVECDSTGTCLQGTPASVNAPQFFRINFEERSIRGTRQDGTDVTTKIVSRTADAGQVILQGVEDGRGWSMAIAEKTGRMTLTASGQEIGFIVFGACTTFDR